MKKLLCLSVLIVYVFACFLSSPLNLPLRLLKRPQISPPRGIDRMRKACYNIYATRRVAYLQLVEVINFTWPPLLFMGPDQD